VTSPQSFNDIGSYRTSIEAKLVSLESSDLRLQVLQIRRT
jgi:hypothetical protein